MATQFAGDGSFVTNLSVSAFRAVSISSNRGITYAGAAEIPAGLTQADAESGDLVAVKFFSGPGTHKCELTAAPVTVGDTVFAGALGRVSTTGTITVGKSLSTATANGSVIEFVPLR